MGSDSNLKLYGGGSPNHVSTHVFHVRVNFQSIKASQAHLPHPPTHTLFTGCGLLVIMAAERSSLFIIKMLWQFVRGLNIKQEILFQDVWAG